MKRCTKCLCVKPEEQFYYSAGKSAKAYSECRACFRLRMNLRHEQIKLTLINEMGGRCSRCSYNKVPRILCFHHLDPAQKSFTIGQKLSVGLEKLREEIKKCMLLCPNCHAEEHTPIYDFPSYIYSGDISGTFQNSEQVRKQRYCACGHTITSLAVHCQACAAKNRLNPTKIRWPSTEVLLEKLQLITITALAKELGVSGNAIRKRIKNHS